MNNVNRVMAVDDNPTNLTVIEETLQDRFNLRLFDNGKDALRNAATFLPDVVLLDVMMPRPDGYEVCSALRNDPLLRYSSIIMVSASTAIEARLRAYRAGANDYVCKPFDEEELLAKVVAALNVKNDYQSLLIDLESFYYATGEVLELLAHLRDTETGDHMDRIRIYSHLLAAELRSSVYGNEIDDVFLDHLLRASALHDIGKVGIPDALLHKPGNLTPEERAIMDRHTVDGERVLQRLAVRTSAPGYFEMAAQIARSHHERVDGTGYPDGLKGGQIPLAARIVKVADVFDALTTVRPYKQGLRPEFATEVILRGRGTEFDTVVVDAMLNVLDEFYEVCPREFASECDDSLILPTH